MQRIPTTSIPQSTLCFPFPCLMQRSGQAGVSAACARRLEPERSFSKHLRGPRGHVVQRWAGDIAVCSHNPRSAGMACTQARAHLCVANGAQERRRGRARGGWRGGAWGGALARARAGPAPAAHPAAPRRPARSSSLLRPDRLPGAETILSFPPCCGAKFLQVRS